MKSLAASGKLVLNNSTNVVEGQFNKPETVLDAIANGQSIENGILVITGQNISGRLGIENNSIVTDAVLDKTGETGTVAVCKLLLLPHGSYNFRHSVPSDYLNFQQDLNLPFSDVKRFLSGPSSIGLACPPKQTLNNLKALTVQHSPDFSWESTQFSTSYAKDTGSEHKTSEAQVQDCKKLVAAVDKKRTEEIKIIAKHNQTKTNLEALKKPGPLPKRKEEHKPIDKVFIVAALSTLIGLIGFTMIQNSEVRISSPEEMAVFHQEQDAIESAQALASKSKPVRGTAPFALPSNSSVKETPPAAKPREASNEPVVQPSYIPTGTNNFQDPEIAKWHEAVRKNPRDANARRKLAQAYLMSGDTTSSIEQFYSVMKLRKVESSEIISFADNLMTFGNTGVAKQFLTTIVRSDPMNISLRNRLSELH